MKMSGVKMLASSPMLMFLLSLLMASFFDTTAGQIGVCYGRVGNNLPSPSEVVAMYKKYNFQRMRIYDPNPNVLDALRGTNIELILDIPNSDLAGIASSQTVANTWVQNHVKKYDGVSFKYISVGNEVKPDGPGGAGNFLAQAMQNIDKSLSEAGLSNIKVSTTTYMGAFVDTYPPSNGKFNVTYLSFLQRAIDFLESKRYPLLVNIYTYFSFKDDSDNNPLEYALFQPNNKQFDDYQHHYNNLFDASLDSVYAALEKSGGGSLEVVVSESGWPTQGGKGTSVENAKTYVNNLIQHVKKGSPRTRGKPIETYIFAMFNENNKTPEYEKYWGLFLPDKQPQYEVIFD